MTCYSSRELLINLNVVIAKVLTFADLINSDINECNRDICTKIDENAECKNTRPFYECKCKKGFKPLYNNSVDPRTLINCTGKRFL